MYTHTHTHKCQLCCGIVFSNLHHESTYSSLTDELTPGIVRPLLTKLLLPFNIWKWKKTMTELSSVLFAILKKDFFLKSLFLVTLLNTFSHIKIKNLYSRSCFNFWFKKITALLSKSGIYCLVSTVDLW